MVQLSGGTDANPRSAMESQEQEEIEDELAFAFGRILIWLLQAKKPELVGFRAYVLAHKLRPDLIEGMTLQDIGALVKQGRSNAHNLSKELTLTFGIRGRNEQSESAKRERRQAWKDRGATPAVSVTSSHLQVLNHFSRWQGSLQRYGVNPRSPAMRETLKRDLAPLLAFARELG